MRSRLFLAPLDNFKLLGTWRINEVPNIPGKDPTVETYSYAADSNDVDPGVFRFRVHYDPNDNTKYKEFYGFVARRDNAAGVANIFYWPIDGYGTVVYSDTKGRWKPTEGDAINWGYDLTMNRTITITKSLLTWESKLTKLLAWFQANATKLS